MDNNDFEYRRTMALVECVEILDCAHRDIDHLDLMFGLLNRELPDGLDPFLQALRLIISAKTVLSSQPVNDDFTSKYVDKHGPRTIGEVASCKEAMKNQDERRWP